MNRETEHLLAEGPDFQAQENDSFLKDDGQEILAAAIQLWWNWFRLQSENMYVYSTVSREILSQTP